jgi:Ni/Co efflux regulator RcnB
MKKLLLSLLLATAFVAPKAEAQAPTQEQIQAANTQISSTIS